MPDTEEFTFSPEAVAQTYEDAVNLIRFTVWRYIIAHNRSPRDYDELFSRANFYFMHAYISHDPTQSEFTTWLVIQIWGRLLNEDRMESKHWHRKQHPREKEGLQEQPDLALAIELADELNEDTKSLLLIVQESLQEIEKLVKNRDRRYAPRRLFAFLRREKKWSKEQINNAFRGIRQTLIPHWNNPPRKKGKRHGPKLL